MPTTYTVSADDYIRCAQINSEPRKHTRLLRLLTVAVMVFAGSSSLLRGDTLLGCAFIAGAVLAAVFPWLLTFVIAPYTHRRHYQKYKKMQAPISVELTDEGLCFSLDSGSTTLKWADIHAWRGRDDYLLIYLAPNIYHSLPMRIGDSGFPIATLKERLLNTVGASI